MSNPNPYSNPVIGDGVSQDLVMQLAPLWEAACKAEDAEWSKKNPAPLPGWDGNVWFDRIEDRQRRWRSHYLAWAGGWWKDHGLSVAFDANARITGIALISQPDERITP